MTYFTARSNLVPSVFIWEKCLSCRFRRDYWSMWGESGTYSQINEYMMIYDNPRSRSFIDLCPRSLRFNIFKLLFLKKRKSVWSQISYGASMGCWDEKLFKCSGSHDLDGFQAPYMVKTLKNLLVRNQEADDLEIWYTASSTQELPNLFKWWHWVDLDHFYNIVNFCFLRLLHGWKLIHYIVMYFQACSNSAYPMHSGERYRTNGPLVYHYMGYM